MPYIYIGLYPVEHFDILEGVCEFVSNVQFPIPISSLWVIRMFVVMVMVIFIMFAANKYYAAVDRT